MASVERSSSRPFAASPANLSNRLRTKGAPGPVPGAYWVLEKRLAAGAHPSAAGRSPEEVLCSLLAVGVNVLIDLTEEDAPVADYRSLLDEVGPETIVERYPIADLAVPSTELASDVLDSIDRHLDQGRNVYVHCLGGLGRTGTIIACWLIRRQLAAADGAVGALASLRESLGPGRGQSPETDEQRRFVAEWSS